MCIRDRIGTCVEALGVTLEAKPVRGVVSNGMMCSYSELGIEGDSSGIIELPNDIEAVSYTHLDVYKRQ